ncbi:MAG: hypothetical protein ABIJ95_08295 [Pseudomonadota bacterium]
MKQGLSALVIRFKYQAWQTRAWSLFLSLSSGRVPYENPFP